MLISKLREIGLAAIYAAVKWAFYGIPVSREVMVKLHE
jgi:hypothetical protein